MPTLKRKAVNAMLGTGQDEEASDGEVSLPKPLAARKLIVQVRVLPLPTTSIILDPTNPRSGELPGIASLKSSIRRRGLLQPISVVRAEGSNGDEEFYVAKVGNRRLKAFQELQAEAAAGSLNNYAEDEQARYQNYTVIPALVITDGGGDIDAILSNTQMVELPPEDKATAFKRLHDEFGYSDKEIGEIFNLGRETINRYRNNADRLAAGETLFDISHPTIAQEKVQQAGEAGNEVSGQRRTANPYRAIDSYVSYLPRLRSGLEAKANKGRLSKDELDDVLGKLQQVRTALDQEEAAIRRLRS